MEFSRTFAAKSEEIGRRGICFLKYRSFSKGIPLGKKFTNTQPKFDDYSPDICIPINY
ncbi:MAG: hypothetical protein ACI9XO_003344 [Paraglaciecola sp.]|jgi:hypothetical protein